MGVRRKLTEKERAEQIERIQRYDKENKPYTVFGQILNLVAVNGLVSIKAILLLSDYTNATLNNKMYSLQQLGWINKRKEYVSLKNLNKTYKEIKTYIPNLDREIVEGGLKKAKSTSNIRAKERLGGSSEITAHILNMNIGVYYELEDIDKKGYIISSYMKKEVRSDDISRTRVIGFLIDKENSVSYNFYKICESELYAIQKNAEKNIKKLIKVDRQIDVIVMDRLDKIVNLFTKKTRFEDKESEIRHLKKELMLDKLEETVLIYPNTKQTHRLMEITFMAGYKDAIERLFPKNHHRQIEVDLIEGDTYTLYFLYPNVKRLYRFYKLMYREPRNYRIVTFEDYKDIVKSLNEELGIEIEIITYTVDEIIEKIIGGRQ